MSVGPSGTAGRSSTTAATGGTASSPATAPPGTSRCLRRAGGTIPCDPATADPREITGTNCHGAPASTAVGLPGGGEIVCDPLPGQSEPGAPGQVPGQPPMTTVPGDDRTVSTINTQPYVPMTSTTITAAAGQGVLHGTASGGLDCKPDQPCPAIGIIVSGTVSATRPDGTVAATAEIDGFGTWGMAVPPGTYRITVSSKTDDRCEPATTTATAGATTEVNLPCLRPVR